MYSVPGETWKRVITQSRGTYKDRVTQKEGGGSGPKGGVRVVKREGQGREKERFTQRRDRVHGRRGKRRTKGGKGGQGPREGSFIHVFE